MERPTPHGGRPRFFWGKTKDDEDDEEDNDEEDQYDFCYLSLKTDHFQMKGGHDFYEERQEMGMRRMRRMRVIIHQYDFCYLFVKNRPLANYVE